MVIVGYLKLLAVSCKKNEPRKPILRLGAGGLIKGSYHPSLPSQRLGLRGSFFVQLTATSLGSPTITTD